MMCRCGFLVLFLCILGLIADAINISKPFVDSRCKHEIVKNPSPLPDAVAPDVFSVVFGTNGEAAEPVTIRVVRSWSPLGADRFFSLVRDGFYDHAAFFRVVPDFVVQFGIAAEPKETEKWNTIIPDDPVLVSNTQWRVTYATAGANTRTSQV